MCIRNKYRFLGPALRDFNAVVLGRSQDAAFLTSAQEFLRGHRVHAETHCKSTSHEVETGDVFNKSISLGVHHISFSSTQKPRRPLEWFNLPRDFNLVALGVLQMRPAVRISGRVTGVLKMHLQYPGSTQPPGPGSQRWSPGIQKFPKSHRFWGSAGFRNNWTDHL